jgi:sulfur-carrier protein adenylyltransferase/sulfurtransferase
MSLSSDELARYARHLTLPEVGPSGQTRLRGSSVLLIGAGGLGSPLALYLAAAGVGRIGIVEYDTVDVSNLQRQVLYGQSDVGARKLLAAVRRLNDLNPHVEIVPHETRLAPENARALVGAYDVVADGSDNFATRYLVNDAGVLEGVPVVYGSINRFEGQVTVLAAPAGPCYRCLYPEPPPAHLVPSCAEGGVLGVLPGLVGTLQATEVIKWLLGIGEPLVGRLLLIDALATSFHTLSIERDPDCPICGDHPVQVDVLSDYDLFCNSRLPGMSVPEISVSELKERLDRGERPFILDVRQQMEKDIADLGGTLIPVDELPDRIEEIDPHAHDDLVVVYCRTGARSAKAVGLLKQHGFDNVVNLKGGIHAWADDVDPSVPKY